MDLVHKKIILLTSVVKKFSRYLDKYYVAQIALRLYQNKKRTWHEHANAEYAAIVNFISV